MAKKYAYFHRQRNYKLYAAGAICVYVKNVRKQAQRYQQSCNTEDNIPHIYNGGSLYNEIAHLKN